MTAELIDATLDRKSGSAIETLVDLWENAVLNHPENPAIVTEGETLTYAEADRRINKLARLLRRAGAGPERLVALALPRSGRMVLGVLAVAKTGAAFLPVDVAHPAERIGGILAEAAPVLLCTTRAAAPGLPEQETIPVIALDAPKQVAALEVLSDEPITDDERPKPIGAHSLAYVIYTSGSTGRPKGVAVTHRGLPGLAAAKISTMRVTEVSRFLQFASPSFDAFLTELTATIGSGAALVVPKPGTLAGETLRAVLREQRITHAVLPPAAAATVSPEDFPDLRTLIVAGEACPAGLVEQWAPYVRFVNAYGPTENTVCATMTGPMVPGEQVTIGKPIAGVDVHVLDRDLRPLPVGEIGELYLAGDALARGYLRRPALTAERFVADPFTANGSRLYRTGDLASRRADGAVLFHGRVDDQVKLRGFRIELGEVESALGRHPEVEQAAVVLREDETGTPHLAAYIVPRGQAEPTSAALREHAIGLLPDYMLPSVYTTLRSLPVNANGKIDRAALPEPGAISRPTVGRTPETPAEKALAAIFADLFEGAEINAASDFFALGGTSILAIDFIHRAQDAGLELTPRTVIENPTIEALAASIENEESAA